MQQSGTYKQYSRNLRSITLDERFNGGMRSDTVPLDEGTYRTIVNYQIMEAGDHIVPRKGKIIDPDVIYTDFGKQYSTVSNRKQYIDSVTHIYSNSDKTDITTLIQTFPMADYKNAVKEIRTNNIGNSVVFYETPLIDMYAVKYNNDTIAPIYLAEDPPRESDKAFNTNSIVSLVGRKHPTEDTVGIHVYDGMGMFKLRPRTISTGLYNYFFAINVKENLDKKFVQYKLDDDELSVEYIEPREITPSVACTTGFNMLSPTPYTFQDRVVETVDRFKLLGLLLYRDADCTKTALSFTPGETVYIKRFYDFPLGQQVHMTESEYTEKHAAFVLRLEVNYGVGDNWQLLDQVGLMTETVWDATYKASHLNVIPFVVPQEDFSLRASIFDTSYCLPLLKGIPGTAGAIGNYYPEDMPPYYETVNGVQIQRYFAENMFCVTQITPTITVTKETDNNKVLIVDEPNYDLTTAQGMLSWKAMIVLWGVEGAPNVVFTSDVDHYNYFPYPNNIEDYEDNILNVIIFMDSLLVITQNSMYKTEFNDDGTFKTTTVATDLNMSYDDALNVITVKNMIFYKSGNYYYMLVPSHKALTFGELNVAPVSTPINYFLDHFDTELKKVLINMYSKELDYAEVEDLTIIPDLYDIYLANDEICIAHNIILNRDYADKTKLTFAFNFILKYNSVSRVWCADLYNTPTGYIQLVFKNIAGVPAYAAFDKEIFGSKIYFRLLSEDNDNCQDSFDAASTVPTKHFLDTGYRALSVANKKRLREIQFKINNKLGVPIKFTSGFILDNERRVNIGSYVLTPVEDKLERVPTCKLLSTNYKTQYDRWIDPSFVNILQDYLVVNDPDKSYFNVENIIYEEPGEDPISTYILLLSMPWDSILTFYVDGDTLVIENYGDSTLFVLDDSHLSLFDVATVRWKVSGKGYLPRVLLLSENIKSYEIFGLGWVARDMNAR